jgi:hypothetical protein
MACLNATLLLPLLTHVDENPNLMESEERLEK